tara:strand:+ start:7657 stop:8175 length:519 start_codon:yes stop_codon:yes gene_type:complete
MYLTESERKRIKALHEASSASAAGSYEIPMSFEAERPEMVGELPDEMDMGISDNEGIDIDFDELMGMLGVSEEEDRKRIRQLHKDNSVVVEQEMPEISELCLTCVKNALGEYSDQAESIATKIMSALSDGEINKTEFMSVATEVMGAMVGISVWDIPSIATNLYGCIDSCKQ